LHKGQVSVLVLALALVVVLLPAAAIGGGGQARATEYVVLYSDGTSLAAARDAVAAAGGTIVSENTKVGVATVMSKRSDFLANVASQGALEGAAHNEPVGYEAPLQQAEKADPAALTDAELASAKSKEPAATLAATDDPLANLQWDMAMIHATAAGSYSKQQGSPGVRVGILDTGVDGTHPDIAPNFDGALSRNFTTDIPSVDGACEVPSCVDPANVDDNGHGTHVAGSVGAALNGVGIAGVAPKVTIVNLRAGQDSGFFFLQPSVDALTFAADNGIDVVNMSYYIDPWLYNCADNPADTPEQQAEQRTIVAATNRALDYAYEHGVTLIGSAGNEHTDTGNPTSDASSPDYPPGTSHPRTVNNSCLVVPTEGNHVISVGAVGPSTMKADYSNWGTEQTQVTAPGGWFRDFFGTPKFRTNENQILSAYPQSLAQRRGQLNPDGTPNTPNVIRSCQGSTCGYYQWLQGTSMASPHAVGVAALIVSQWGHPAPGGTKSGQLDMSPDVVEKILERTATDHACPDPPTISYANEGRPAEFNAVCTGTTEFNSIWGEGIVDALAAVTSRK
jgi:lantibiotic leader peptide-processing serine protease